MLIFTRVCSPAGLLEVLMLMICFTFPASLVPIHRTVLMWSFTVRVMVLLTVIFDTVVVTEYSVWFSSSGHLITGKGDPRLIHVQVRISDLNSHSEFFKIFGNAINTNAEF